MLPDNDSQLRRREDLYLGFILILAMVHGMIYVYVVPPWQHYDEPSHFEYIWLVSNRKRIPQASEFDQSIRREIAASMIENDFFRNLNFFSEIFSF